MARFLWKPQSEKDGNLVILTDAPYPNLNIVLSDGSVIQGNNTGPSNGYGATVRFPSPGGSFNNVQITSPDGTVIQTINSGNDRAELTDPVGQAQGIRPGQFGNSFNGVAGPIAANLDLLTFNPTEFEEADAETIEGVEPLDVLDIADNASDRNREKILQSFEDAREISSELLDSSFERDKRNLVEINDLNADEQGKAFESLGPDAAKTLDNNLRTLKSFSEGRLPDSLENEILNQTSRALQSQQSNITGGGISSSFGNRVASQLSIQQKLGLQESSLNNAPSFLARALELRRGTPQKLQFNPDRELNTRASVASSIAESQLVNPVQAINAEFKNQDTELTTQKTNADIKNTTNQFNARGIYEANTYNAGALTKFQESLVGYDLFNQREQQNFVQNVLNREREDAAVNQAQQNADRQQQSREEQAQGDTVGDIISAIPDVVDAGSRIVDSFNEDDDKTPSPNLNTNDPVASTELPDGSPGVVDSDGNVSPAPVVNSPERPIQQLPIDSGGNIITPPSEPVASVPLPDGSAGVVDSNGNVSPDYSASVENYEPDVTAQDDLSYRSANLSVSPSQVTRAYTTPTEINTRQVQAHKNARATVPRMLPVEELSQDQIQYRDGTKGYDVNKSVQDLQSVEGPIPAVIIPDTTRGDVKEVASNIKSVIQAFDRPGKIAKPTKDSKIFNTKNVSKEVFRQIGLSSPAEKAISDLGNKAFENVMDLVTNTPVSFDVPTEDNGVISSNIEDYLGTIFGAINA